MITQTTAFVLTLLIEVPLVVALSVGLGIAAPSRVARVLLPVGASTLTHPLLWMARDLVTTWPLLLGAELVVALVEGTIYALVGRYGLWRGLAISLLANATSFGIGCWITR